MILSVLVPYLGDGFKRKRVLSSILHVILFKIQ